MFRVLGLVTARGGSKGIPRKNISPLAGKPLIAWTLEAAAASHNLDRLLVSTDDNDIAEVCRSWGVETPFQRPVELAQDASSHIGVVLHALDWLATHDGYRPDAVMLLQPTSPLRTTEDVDAAIEKFQEYDAKAVLSVVETHHHPYLSRTLQKDQSLSPFIVHDVAYPRRQDIPAAFALNGAIYLNRRDTLLAARDFEPEGTIGYVMPPERSLQIDTPWDLHLCELILKDRLRGEDPFVLRGREHAVFGDAYASAGEAEAAMRRVSTR